MAFSVLCMGSASSVSSAQLSVSLCTAAPVCSPVRTASILLTQLVSVSFHFSCSVKMGMLSPMMLSIRLSPTACRARGDICR